MFPVTEFSDQTSGADGQIQPEDSTPLVAMPAAMDDDWENWSDGDERMVYRTDGEADFESEDKIAQRLKLAANTALPCTPGTVIMREDQVRVTTRTPVTPRQGADTQEDLNDRSSETYRSIAYTDSLSFIPPEDERSPSASAYAFLVDAEQKRRAKKIRVGKVSVMAPFSEFDVKPDDQHQRASSPRKSVQKSTRTPLQNMEFGHTRASLALLQLADPLVPVETTDDNLENDERQQDEIARFVSGRRKASIRKKRLDIIKHSIAVRDTEIIRYQVTRHQRAKEVFKREHETINSLKQAGDAHESDGRFIYPIQKLDIQREVVMRRASQVVTAAASNDRDNQPTSSTQPSAESVKKKFSTQAEWLRSVGLDQPTLKSPRPPPSRAPNTALKSRREKNGVAEFEDENREAMMPNDQRREPRRYPRRRKLKQVLPTLAQPRYENAEAPDDSQVSCEGKSANREFSTVSSSLRLKRMRTLTQGAIASTRLSNESIARSDDNDSEYDEQSQNDSINGTDDGSEENASGSGTSEEEEYGSESDAEVSDLESSDGKDVAEHGDEDTDSAQDAEESEDLPGEDHHSEAQTDHQRNQSRNGPRSSPRRARKLSKRLQHQSRRRQVEAPTTKRSAGGKSHVKFSPEPRHEEEHLSTADADTNDCAVLSGGMHDMLPRSFSRLTPSRSKQRSALAHEAAERTLGLSSEDDDSDHAAAMRTQGERRGPELARATDAAAARQEKKKRARHAAFQRLMMQHLWLLQCTPSSVMTAKPH
ncbi:hypothetical protein FI667_g14515, partial [Globisporangium splendens]